ncbi:dihydroneopterin aldolase [Tissierella creatinini]|nr:dihydroneopterin aldolase [Tissierella creatinini]TJX64690.1 dihydroneopterin aldolase [Soehngenia saccharolytica]
MDSIIMNNMVFYAYHGVMQEEKVLGQKFHVDAKLYLNLNSAGRTDNLNYTVSYAEVYELIKKIVTEEKFDLLEALSHRLCERILTIFAMVEEVEITVRKPGAPVAGNFDFFGVQIKRSRDDYA